MSKYNKWETVFGDTVVKEEWILKLCEKALWGLQHVNYIKTKADTETQYQHGFRLGYNQAKRLGLDLIEKVIEELKKA